MSARESQLAQSRCSNVVSTFAERLNNVAIDVVSTFFCELVGTYDINLYDGVMYSGE